MSKVLVIGDTHCPADHPGYLDFCSDTAEKYRCSKFVHIGDVVDWHSLSRFDKEPEAASAGGEYDLARNRVARWNKRFPNMTVCEGNHDYRAYKTAAVAGIPARLLKGYNATWDTNWKWVVDTIIDDVYYFHGTGVSGVHPAFNTMQKMLMSTVMGHIHQAGGIKWRANPQKRLFGMDAGCGVDDKHIAFKYGEHLKVRSILSCGVILDGNPMHVIMPAGHGEKYHRSRF